MSGRAQRESGGSGKWVSLLLGLLVAAGALVGSCSAPPPPPAGDSIGKAIAVDPAASIATPPVPALVAQLDSPVHANDLIETGPDGAIRVQFVDSTFFSLGANGSVRIDSFVFDPARSASSLSLSFARGAFRFVSGKPVHANPGQPAIKTPVAVLGIRGTGVIGVIGPEAEALYRRIDSRFVPDGGDSTTATLILLTDGAIDVDGSGVRIALDVPGQVIFFRRRGAPPLRPGALPDAIRTEMVALASPPSLGPEPGGGPPSGPELPADRPTPSPISDAPVRAAEPTPQPEPTASASPAPLPVPPVVRPDPRPSPSPFVRPSPRPTPTVATPSPRPTRPLATPSPRPTRPVATPTLRPAPTFTPAPRPRPTPIATPTPRQPITTFTPRPRPTPTPTPRQPVTTFTPRPRPTPTPTGINVARPPRPRATSATVRPTPTPTSRTQTLK